MGIILSRVDLLRSNSVALTLSSWQKVTLFDIISLLGVLSILKSKNSGAYSSAGRATDF